MFILLLHNTQFSVCFILVLRTENTSKDPCLAKWFELHLRLSVCRLRKTTSAIFHPFSSWQLWSFSHGWKEADLSNWWAQSLSSVMRAWGSSYWGSDTACPPPDMHFLWSEHRSDVSVMKSSHLFSRHTAVICSISSWRE